MREIKFRIYDKELKESHIEELQELCEDDYWYDGETEVWSVLKDCNSEQERFVALQYTGLEDKNGVEIYEGDILKIPEWLWEDEQEYCVCIYQQENEVCDVYGFGLYIKDGYSGKYKVRVPSDEWDEFEVVGNIYDNPELIEKEGKVNE